MRSTLSPISVFGKRGGASGFRIALALGRSKTHLERGFVWAQQPSRVDSEVLVDLRQRYRRLPERDVRPVDEVAAGVASMSTGDDQPSESSKAGGEQVVTPWDVAGGADGKIDYAKLVNESDAPPRRRAHRPHRKGRASRASLPPPRHALAHRELDQIVTAYEGRSRRYTGRGPSSEVLHLGHLIPFHFTKWLQEAFKCRSSSSSPTTRSSWEVHEARGRQAAGAGERQGHHRVRFDPRRTFIFSDVNYMCTPFYLNVLKIAKCVTFNQARGIFGFSGESNIGQVGFPPTQAAPAFPDCFHLFGTDKKSLRCLIPCAIDQDPYFRMTRDAAPRIGGYKPALSSRDSSRR